MKILNAFTTFMFALLLVVFAQQVSALPADLTASAPSTIDANDIIFTHHRGDEFTVTFTVTATADLTDVNVQVDSAVRNDYNIRFDNIAAATHSLGNIDNGDSVTFDVEMRIPARNDAGIKELIRNNAFTITANEGSQNYNLFYNSPSHLRFVSVETRVNGRSAFSANPLDNVEVIVTYENTFSENIRIENIDVDLIIFNFEDSGFYDFEDYVEIRSISSGREGRATFSFSVPFDIYEDIYDIEIEARGRDQRGAIHESELSTDSIEIRRNRNELYLRTTSLSRTSLSCENTRTTLDVDLYNIGSRFQDDVMIIVENEDLSIFEERRGISLESIEYDDRDARAFESFHLRIPEDAETGTYYLDISVYMSGAIFTRDQVRFDVRDCPIREEPVEERPTSPPIVIEERPEEPTIITPTPIDEVDDVSESVAGDTMLFLLAGLNLLLVIAVVALLAVVLRKPKRKEKYL